MTLYLTTNIEPKSIIKLEFEIHILKSQIPKSKSLISSIHESHQMFNELIINLEQNKVKRNSIPLVTTVD